MSELVALIDGTKVAATSDEWKAECAARFAHVQAMRRLDTQGRRIYLEGVERAEGPEALRRLKDAFLYDWETRKGAR